MLAIYSVSPKNICWENPNCFLKYPLKIQISDISGQISQGRPSDIRYLTDMSDIRYLSDIVRYPDISERPDIPDIQISQKNK